MSGATFQRFDVADAVRVLIERDPIEADGEYANACPNPSGELGGWWWRTPVANTTLTGVPFPEEWADEGDTLVFKTTVSQACAFTSGPVEILEDQWLSVHYREWPGSTWHRVRIDWYNAAGSLLSSTTRSSYWNTGGVVTPRDYGSHQAPTSTAYARVRFDVYADTLGANPAADATWTFNRAALVVTDTEPANTPTAEEAPGAFWTELQGDTKNIAINRTEWNTGTLTVEIVSEALDPAVSTVLRPGRRIVVQALTVTDGDTVAEPLFTGKTAHARTEYAPLNPEGQRARVTVTAHDAMAQLAATRAPDGYHSIDDLPAVLELAGEPWNINGYGNQVTATPDATGDTSATAADQVTRTRDTGSGYAWIDRKGIVNVHSVLASTTGTYTAADFNPNVVVAYDTARAINTITVKNIAGTTTTETTHADADSVREWGPLPAAFTVIDVPLPAVYADGLFTANATPQPAVESIQFAMATQDDINEHATRDLCQTLQVLLDDLEMAARITGIEHQIVGQKWLTTYTLADSSRRPIPTT